jgi:hypothetical protein
MIQTCHANARKVTQLKGHNKATPSVTAQFNSHKHLQGWLAESHPLGVGPERDVTALRSKGSVTCHNRSNAQSMGPQSVTVSRTHPRGTV